ncbi:MAG: hypothetical protein D6772_08065 [Bacteroidetes bacterium]|nr:MAG: hypothetical protein D6772_08065 [Bacteroidota bacterium]
MQYTCVDIPSPFFDLDQPNTVHLVGGAQEPGWVVLYEELGSISTSIDDAGNEVELVQAAGNPNFALYHRKSGRVRVFFYLYAIPNFQSATIAVKHPDIGPSSSARPGLLEWWQEPAYGLDERQLYNENFYQVNTLKPTGFTWAMLEFTVAYDPCVCEAKSFLEFDPTYWSFNLDEITGQLLSYTWVHGTPSAIFVPNSPFDPPSPAIQSLLPHYDKPLGVFNVLETPTVEVIRTSGPNPYVQGFRVQEPIRYVVNPYADLGEPTEVEAALYWEKCYLDDFEPYTSPAVGLSCLSDHVFVVNTGAGYEGRGFDYPNCIDEP